MCIYILEVFFLTHYPKNLFKIQISECQPQETKTSGSGGGGGGGGGREGAEICVFNKHPGVSDPGGLEK